MPSVVVDRLARRTTETTKKEAPSHASSRAKRLPCVTIVLLRRASRPIDRMVKCADRASSAGPGSLESFSSPVPVATTTLRVAVIFRSDRFLVPIRLGDRVVSLAGSTRPKSETRGFGYRRPNGDTRLCQQPLNPLGMAAGLDSSGQKSPPPRNNQAARFSVTILGGSL